MTRDDIIKLAREAGMERVIDVHKDGTRTIELPHPDLLERFAALVAANAKSEQINLAYQQGYEEGSVHEREKQSGLVEIIENLWNIIDDVDTYGDMAKADDKLYRSLVERRQKDRWKTGITTDGYTLTIPDVAVSIEAAVLAEREACAKLANDFKAFHGDVIADAIRARGQG